jgi:hypothetical protein
MSVGISFARCCIVSYTGIITILLYAVSGQALLSTAAAIMSDNANMKNNDACITNRQPSW